MINSLIINEIESIDDVVNESKIDQLMTIASIYDKQYMIIEEYQYRNKPDTSGFNIFQESFYQEAEQQPQQKELSILDKATGKGKNENILIKIVAFIPRLVGAIIDSIKKMFNKQSMKTAEQCAKELSADKSKSRAKTVLSILAAGGLGVAGKTAFDKLTGTKNKNDDSDTNQQNEALIKDKAELEKDKAELVKKISEFEAKIAKDDSQSTLKDQVIKNLQKQLADQVKNNENLVVDVKAFERELKKANSDLAFAKDSKRKLVENIQNLEKSKGKVQEKLDYANEKLNEFRQSLGDHISTAKTLYKNFIDSMKIDEADKEQLKSVPTLEGQLKSVIAAYKELQEELAITKYDNTNKTTFIDLLQSKSKNLTKELDKAKAEIKRVSDENETALRNNDEAEAKIKQLEKTIADAALENGRLQAFNRQALAELLRKDTEIANLKGENSSSKANVSELNAKLAAKEKELANAKTKIAEVQNTINQQTENNNKKDARITTLEKELEGLKSEKQELENSVKGYRDRIDQNNNKWEKVNNENKQLQGDLATANEKIKQAQDQAKDDVKKAQKDAADKIANEKRRAKDAETRANNKDAAYKKQAADFEQERQTFLQEIDKISRNSAEWRSKYEQSQTNGKTAKEETKEPAKETAKKPTEETAKEPTEKTTEEQTKETNSTESGKKVISVKDLMNVLTTSVHDIGLTVAAIRTLKSTAIIVNRENTEQDDQSSKKEAIANIKKIVEQSNEQTSAIISNLEKLDKTGRQISGNAYKSALTKERKKNGNDNSNLLFYFRSSDNNDGSIDMVSKIDLSILIENLNKVKASINVIKKKKDYDKIISDNKDKYESKKIEMLNRDHQMIYTISSIDGFNRLRDDFKQIINESQSLIDDIKTMTKDVNETDNEEIAKMQKIQSYISAYSQSITGICVHLDYAMRAYTEACRCVSKK